MMNLFANQMKPFAAGNRYMIKPKMADPHHRCPFVIITYMLSVVCPILLRAIFATVDCATIALQKLV